MLATRRPSRSRASRLARTSSIACPTSPWACTVRSSCSDPEAVEPRPQRVRVNVEYGSRTTGAGDPALRVYEHPAQIGALVIGERGKSLGVIVRRGDSG